MARRHLTEEEIQDYLDGNLSELTADLRLHLETCETCQGMLKQYRHLYTGLEEDPGFQLPKIFVKKLVSKLSTDQAKPFLSPSAEIILIVVGVLLALGTTIFLVDLKPIAETMSRIALPKIKLSSTILQPMKNMMSGLNSSLGLLPFAALALILVAVFDRFIHKFRHNKMFL